MSTQKTKEVDYKIVRSRRATADIVVERDGRIIVRAPSHLPDERVEDIVEAKRYWIYKTLASGGTSTPRACCVNTATAKAFCISAALIASCSSPGRRNRSN